MAGRGQWQSSEVVAWTGHDGPGRPPRGPSRVLPVALAATLGAVLVGMLATDTLCPEHRTWVQVLGLLGIAGTGVAIFGLVQRWAVAPALTLVVALDGVAIGFIDAIHDANRGHLVALAFGLSAVMAVALSISSVPLSVWDRRVRRQLAPSAAVPAPETPAGPTEVPASRHDDEALLTPHE
jgi:hypothetical protein